MYDITKTRILLTTAVFAAVAAVFAGGGSARIPEEDGSGIGAEPAAQAAQGSGTFSVGEICTALDLEQLRGVLINEPAIKAATPDAIQECSHARAAQSIAPVLASSEATQGVSEWAVISRSGVVSRYLDNNRTSTSQKRVARPGPTSSPTAVAAFPRRRATSRAEDGADAAPSSRR
jgi:hypothetical protein